MTDKDLATELLFILICAAIIAIGEGGRRALLRLGHAHETLLRSRTHLKFRVRQKTAQLQQGNKDLRDLSVRLLRVQDDERRRIARDLHDSTGQALTALKLELASIERELAGRNPQLAVRLAACIGDARMISDELRTISYLLHPPLLDELGLASALRWYVDGFEKRCGIAVNLELDITERQAPEMETMLFRVVQECLINIHRHSGSAVASIRLSHTERQLIMEVEDEGRGLTVDELCRHCCRRNDGRWFARNARAHQRFWRRTGSYLHGQGTKVRAVIPIDVRSSRAIPAPAADTLTASEIAKRAAAR